MSGGIDGKKRFLIKAITEYFKQARRDPNQNPDEPYVLVTASTGKAATGINGIAMNSVCHLAGK